MSGESRFQIAAGRRIRLRLLVCVPIAVVFAAVAVTLFAGVASAAAAEGGGGVFGSLVAPGVSPSFVSGGGDPSFGEPGEGAGQIGSPHRAQSGYTEVVGGVEVDHVTGDVYVADAVNRRIDEFTEDGTFVRAWGWGVDKANPELKSQECVGATGCQKGEAGGGAGELSRPVGIAVGGEAGSEAVYVLESGIHGGNDRVQEFTLSGAFVRMWGGKVNKKGGDVCAVAEASECQQGSEGSGGDEFENVGLQGAIAAGPDGLVYVGDAHPTVNCSTEPECGRVQEFEADGKFVSSFLVSAVGQVEALTVTSGGQICLTVNPIADYTQESPPPEVRCYNTSGTLEHTIELEEQPYTSSALAFIGLAADGSGRLLVDQYEEFNPSKETVQAVFEYDEAGQQLERLLPPGGDAGSPEREPGGFALLESGGAASGVMVVSRSDAVVRSEALPPPGPIVIGEQGVPGEPASIVRLKASIDPEDHATEYRFEYGAEVANEASTATVKMVAHGFKPEAVEARVSGLKAGTSYHFHVVAEDSEGHVVEGADQTVMTLPALRVDTVAVGEVSADGAKFEAEVDTLGSASEYWFEYAAAGEAEHLSETFQIAAGGEEVAVSAGAQGLRPDTAYAYRIVAKNALGEASCGGQCERRFVTQRAGAPLALLDGRAWEQVSPPDKGVANITLLVGGGDNPLRATPNGEAITYLSRGSSEAEPQGERLYAQNVSRHGPDGWSTVDIDSPNAQRYTFESGLRSGYVFFSEDLRLSVLEPSPYTSLSQWTSQEPEVYVRDEAKCPVGVVSVAEVQASECYLPLLTDEGPFADISENVQLGGVEANSANVLEATPDLSHIVLSSEHAELVAGAGPDGLYEWSAGKLVALSLAPGGSVCARGSLARNAFSPNGEIAVWSTPSGSACAGHLYLRENAMRSQSVLSGGRCSEPEQACTVQLDEVQQGGSGAGGPEAYYQDASVGDEHVFFTDSQRLTEGSTGAHIGLATAADLYEYSFNRASDTGRVTDMTAPVNAGEAADVLSVAGASEDGSVVYAIANGVLTVTANAREEHATPGAPNLYKLERVEGAWKATFIATLSVTDQPDWENHGEAKPAVQTTRVSPDGHWLAFMSDRSLSGYDNEDVTSRTPGERMDEEVFLYDANDSRVVCASCDPTGARPHGMLIQLDIGGEKNQLIDREQVWGKRWVAGAVSVSYMVGATRQPRYLSNGGRLFFDSTDGLASSDRNGVSDAYEYEPPANGETVADGANDTCTAGAVTYSQAAEGCVDLISSGTSPEESVFIEASENGNDAFFLTSEKLAASDLDSAYDVYDAHVCGSGWECASPPAVSPPCTGTESCRGAPVPQPSIYGSPASATFSGAGNVAPTGQANGTTTATKKATIKKVAGCAKGKRRVRGKCVKRKTKTKKARRKTKAKKARRSSKSTRGGKS